MHFKRGLYQDEENVIIPTLEKIEMIYDALQRLPDKDEARFFSLVQHKYAAEHLSVQESNLYLISDAYNWLKFFWYANIYKTIKLIDGLIYAYNNQNHLTWMILSRAICEYSAVFYYYKKNIDNFKISSQTIKLSQYKELDGWMLKFTRGTRFNWAELFQGDIEKLAETYSFINEKSTAVNVLTALEHLKKRDERFRDVETTYAMLSDFAHPNMASHCTVIDVPSAKRLEHVSILTANPNSKRGEFIVIFSIGAVHLFLSNIMELIIQLAEPIERLLDIIEGKEHITIDFGG